MAEVTINDLPEGTNVSSDDVFVFSDQADSTDKKVTRANVEGSLDVSSSSVTSNSGTQSTSDALNSRTQRTELSKSVAGGSDVALTESEAANPVIILTGTLTADINVTIPDGTLGQYLIINNTDGGFSVTLKTVSGSGVVVPQGLTERARADGADVVSDIVSPYYYPGNIVGTVSQSGGVPTGAIIERGSNSDGEYVLFADGTAIAIATSGTLIASDDVAGSSGIYSSSVQTIPSPITFAGIPTVSYGLQGVDLGSTVGWPSLRDVDGSTTASVIEVGFSSPRQNAEAQVDVTAFGTWY